jgi:hypothetical protein
MAIGSSIGGAVGGIAGMAVGGPLGSAVGSAAGSLIGGAIQAIPALIKTDAEKENEKRLAALRRQQEMGTLGLTESEKQSLYTAGTNQIGSRLQQAQQQARAVGASGMASGAGAAQLQQAQLAETQANLAAGISQSVEQKNLERKRELEDEIQARVAADSEANQQRIAALSGVAATGVQAGFERFALEKTIQGQKPSGSEVAAVQKLYGLESPDQASGFIEFLGRNPNAAQYAALLGQGSR